MRAETAAARFDLETETALDLVIDEAACGWRGKQRLVNRARHIEIGIAVAIAIPEVQNAADIVIGGARNGR